MISYQKHNSTIPYNFDVYVYNDFKYVPHLHKDLELVYVLEGEVLLSTNNLALSVKQGEFALILPNQAHSYTTPRFSKAYVVVFSQDFVPEFAKHVNGKQGSPLFTVSDEVKDFVIKNLVNANYTTNSSEIAKPEVKLRLSAVFNLVCAEYLSNTNLTVSKKKAVELYSNIIEYVSSHFTEEISLDTLAEYLGYEKHYVSRYFNKCFDTNFRTFVNSYRINLAKQLLLIDNAKITDISIQCGFGSIRSFNRTFKELEGKTPSEFLSSL